MDHLDAIDLWVAGSSADTVATLGDINAADGDFIREWIRTATGEAKPGLLAALVIEEQLCSRATTIPPYFKSAGRTFSDALLLARQWVASAAISHGFKIPFHRPVVLARSLRTSIQYLRSIVDVSEPVPNQDEVRARRDLAQAIVTLARFERVPRVDLDLARTLLRRVVDEGSPTEKVLSNYLEACLDLYHLTGDRAPLVEAASSINQATGMVADDDWSSWHLNVAEVWLALAEKAESRKAENKFLERARESVDKCSGMDLEVTPEIRHRMLDALIGHFEGDGTAKVVVRGIRFPFGLRVSSANMPEAFFDAASRIVAALEPAAQRGQYQYRDTLAELHSYLARHAGNRADVIAHLAEATRFREPVANKEALQDSRSSLAQAQDYLMLAKLDPSRRSYRSRGIDQLLDEVKRDETPDALILLAREIETNGPGESARVVATPEIMSALRRGDVPSLLGMAAERAMRSPDLRRKGLGGRSGVVAVEDYAGLTGETFVFKQMPELCLDRDEDRAAMIGGLVESQRLGEKFGVIEHISRLDVPGSEGAEVISVRRFANGRSLRRLIETDPNKGAKAFDRAVDFLAFFHAHENINGVPSPQKDLRRKDIGRYLEGLVGAPRDMVLYSEWLELVAGIPMVRRRDAHTLNWLVDSDGRILAIDLESFGARPLGYELAQMTDDYPIFDPEDIPSRRRILEHYVERLARYGREEEIETAWRGYLAGLAARAVSVLTDPNSSEKVRMHGSRILETLSNGLGDSQVSLWAKQVRDAWNRKVGLVASEGQLQPISEGDRKRISRAMSFHLRHNPGAPSGPGGWVFAEELADLLRASGHKVTAEQLLVVAGAMGEPRFELDGEEIRAAYGHSIPLRSDFKPKQKPKVLYHATSIEALTSIFEARSGLLPMTRQMVHFTDNPDAALRVFSRARAPQVILRVDPSRVPDLVYAAASTWLASGAPAESLTVLTLREVGDLLGAIEG